MKKHINIRSYCCIAVLFVTTSVAAQSDIAMAPKKMNTQIVVNNIPLDLDPAASGTKLKNSDVSDKVHKTFSKLYKNSSPSWTALDKNFLATFYLDDRYTRALFTGSGYMMYTIIRGTEKNLPADVRRIIKSNYIDFSIGTVNEVRVNDKTAWFVNLQDTKELIVVKVVDDEMEEVSRYKLSR